MGPKALWEAQCAEDGCTNALSESTCSRCRWCRLKPITVYALRVIGWLNLCQGRIDKETTFVVCGCCHSK
jgi:hypothetical protein